MTCRIPQANAHTLMIERAICPASAIERLKGGIVMTCSTVTVQALAH